MDSMTVLVVGAGAIGGVLAARLALAGHRVAIVARGAHCAATAQRGALLLETSEGVACAPVAAYDTLRAAPDAQAVFVTVKAHQLAPIADDLAPRVRAAQVFVPIQNGIPWWYFQHSEGPHAGRIVRAVDPDGHLAALLGNAVIVPAFAQVAAEVVAPGRVVHQAFAADAFPLGPLAAAHEDAAARAAALIGSAGFNAPLTDVRRFVWVKLLGNVWANPIGALTGATVAQIATHRMGRPLALALMTEAQSVARALGVDPSIDFEQRLERARTLRQGVKASMLQDVERGRETEHAAILGALIELAELARVDVPHVATLQACMELLADNRRSRS
jgi:2-dehydropantoate 2-reductase